MPNGLTLGASDLYLGCLSDFEIFQKMKNWHVRELKKTTEEIEVPDHGLFSAEFPEMWGLLADKGYQGILEMVRGITPKKKPGSRLGLSDETFNRQVSSDHIFVENYFGRLCGLWNLLLKNGDGERICTIIFQLEPGIHKILPPITAIAPQ